MLNEVILVGRAAKDVELRESSNGKAFSYITIAVDGFPNKNGEKTTDFIDAILWEQSAKYASKYIHKGDNVQLKGHLKIRTEETQDGKKRNLIQVVGDNVQAIYSKSNGNSGGNPQSVANRVEPAEDELVIEGDDLPFY